MKKVLGTLFLVVLVTAFGVMAGASELSVTTQVQGGSLSDSINAPDLGTVTLTGKDGNSVTMKPALPWKIIDARGSGAGWYVTVGATIPTSGTKQISLNNLTVSVPAIVKSPDAQTSSDTALINRANGISLTTSATLVAAAVYQGMGSFEYIPEFTLAIPANTYAGQYTSVLTTTLFQEAPAI